MILFARFNLCTKNWDWMTEITSKFFSHFPLFGESSDATQRSCMIMVKPELHSLPKSNQNRKTIQGNSGIRGHILDSSAKSYVLWERSNTVVC